MRWDDPWRAAIGAATAGADPGTVLHGPLDRRCDAAVILAPARAVTDQTVLQVAGLALREALLAVLPPQIPVDLGPGTIAVNGAEAATLRLWRGPGALPDLVLGFDIAVALGRADPGLDPSRTDLREEGVEVSGAELLGVVYRHLLAWLNVWDEDGDAAIAAAWAEAVA